MNCQVTELVLLVSIIDSCFPTPSFKQLSWLWLTIYSFGLGSHSCQGSDTKLLQCLLHSCPPFFFLTTADYKIYSNSILNNLGRVSISHLQPCPGISLHIPFLPKPSLPQQHIPITQLSVCYPASSSNWNF